MENMPASRFFSLDGGSIATSFQIDGELLLSFAWLDTHLAKA